MKGKLHKYFFLASAEVKMVSIYLSSVLILEFRPSTSQIFMRFSFHNLLHKHTMYKYTIGKWHAWLALG